MTQRRQRASRTESSKSSSHPPDHIGLLVAAVLLMLAGWGGLYYLVTTSLPRIGGELWLFFMLLQIAITGTALPIVRFFNVRFTSIDDDVPPSGVIVRQSVWVGLVIVTCAWLQIPRALTPALAAFVMLVVVGIELFLRSRELAAERDR